MNSRLTLLAITTVLLAAFAVPALAAPSEATPDVEGISVRALAKARLALLTARSAKAEARRAARTAQAALNAAQKATGPTGATGPAGAAGATGPAGAAGPAQEAVQSGFAPGPVGTESETYVSLSGGPSVNVTVPASGLIEVWAQVTIEEDGAVALFEDGQKLPGQTPDCGVDEEGRGLLASFIPGEEITLATPASLPLGPFCGGFGPPSSVLFQTSPGPHTYELRYATCGCSPEPVFSQRSLFVGPRL
jgi:hypothetical protein